MTQTVVGQAVRFALNAVGARSLPPHDATAFYQPPSSVPALPGTIIRTEPARFWIDPFRLIPAPARVTRIMFSSSDRSGTPIASPGR